MIPRPDLSDVPDGLILFDGVCVFCSRWVAFVLKHDTERRFRFTAIQSPVGQALARRLGIDPEAPQTNALILDGQAWLKSDAALKVLGAMPPTRALAVGRIAPRALRDALYDQVARNRYRIFGRTEACMVPDPADRARFL